MEYSEVNILHNPFLENNMRELRTKTIHPPPLSFQEKALDRINIGHKLDKKVYHN